MIEAAIIAGAFLFGALWRRVFGGWRPFGVKSIRALNFAVLGVLAGALAYFVGGIEWYWSALMGTALSLSYAPAHGPDSNLFAKIDNDWIELPLRYGILPGAPLGAILALLGNYWGAALVLAGGVAAGLAYAFFRHVGERLTWLPTDPTPHSIVDGRQVYNEFFLGALPCAAFAAAIQL